MPKAVPLLTNDIHSIQSGNQTSNINLLILDLGLQPNRAMVHLSFLILTTAIKKKKKKTQKQKKKNKNINIKKK